MKKNKLTHLDDQGRARMVDIGAKPTTRRTAVASAQLRAAPSLLAAIANSELEKGDAFAAARIAGIQAAKRASDLIPLCHPVPLSRVSIDFGVLDDPPGIRVTAEATAEYQTGVEMEALTAVSIAALTLYDMGKSIDRGMTIERIRLEAKSGGTSGDWSRKEDQTE
jgi:cyclic pyranopterin phosphate synthase